MTTDNYVHDNGDAGIALMESFGADIHDNKIENCKYGIRLSLGSGNNDIYDNTFDSSSACEDVIRTRRSFWSLLRRTCVVFDPVEAHHECIGRCLFPCNRPSVCSVWIRWRSWSVRHASVHLFIFPIIRQSRSCITLTTSPTLTTKHQSMQTDGLYTYMGSDEPYVSGNDGRLKNNLFDGNTISNTEVGVKIKESDDTTFTSE